MTLTMGCWDPLQHNLLLWCQIDWLIPNVYSLLWFAWRVLSFLSLQCVVMQPLSIFRCVYRILSTESVQFQWEGVRVTEYSGSEYKMSNRTRVHWLTDIHHELKVKLSSWMSIRIIKSAFPKKHIILKEHLIIVNHWQHLHDVINGN